MKNFAFLCLLCCLASACQTDDLQEKLDHTEAPSITKPTPKTPRAEPTPDEFLRAAARIKVGMTEPQVLQILGKYTPSGILPSNMIHVPSFYNGGRPTMDLIIAFHRTPSSLHPVVTWIGDTVTLHIDGKNLRYSLTTYRHDMARNAVTRPVILE